MKIRLLPLGLLLTGLIANHAQAVDTGELIRASMIDKIARFVEWPTWEDQRFKLCVTDKNPLLPALQSYYENSTLANKPVLLSTFSGTTLPKNCQAVFLSDENLEKLPTILQLTRNQPILIVVEKENIVSQGVHIDFYTDDNRLHLEVNRSAMESSGFKVSYHLLKVARIVD